MVIAIRGAGVERAIISTAIERAETSTISALADIGAVVGTVERFAGLTRVTWKTLAFAVIAHTGTVAIQTASILVRKGSDVCRRGSGKKNLTGCLVNSRSADFEVHIHDSNE